MKLIFKAILASLLIGALPAAAQTNLVLNGDFETGATLYSTSIPDWTAQIAPTGSDYFLDNTEPTIGSFAVNFSGTGGQLDYISQTLTTVPGQEYVISFYVETINTSNEFIANVGGTLQSTPSGFTVGGAGDYVSGGQDMIDLSNVDTPFEQYVTSFIATSTQTDLIFGGYNPLNANYLDNVVFAAVPEPSQWGFLVFLGVAGLVVKRRTFRKV